VVDEKWVTVPAAAGGARVRIVRQHGTTGALPVVFYMHGGWVLGDAGTHDRLVRELTVGAFVESRARPRPATRSPWNGPTPEAARGRRPGRHRPV
jgi:hypothetical protein